MKRLRLQLSWLLWMVAIAAAFLAGIRYGEYRAEARRRPIVDVFEAVEMLGPQDTSDTIIPGSGP
jgi:hypothetical protein